MNRCIVALTFAVASLMSATSLAREFRVNEIPNGSKRGCLNCHRDTSGSSFNDFGSDSRTTLFGTGAAADRHVAWSEFYARDSDGDGYSNGEELGDPSGAWTVGMPNPSGGVTNPGDGKSFPKPVCNNGKLDPGESCEGDLLAKPDCMAVGAGAGKLACSKTCKFDYADCDNPPSASEDVDELGAASNACSMMATPGASYPFRTLLGLLLGAAILVARRRARW